MIRKDYKKLTEEERKIKVFECMGWSQDKQGRWKDSGGNFNPYGFARDPLNDLNFMHDAEKMLQLCDDPNCKNDMCGKGTWGMYTRLLDEAVDDKFQKGGSWGVSYCATAAQRAEAFVLTMSEND